MRSSKGYLVIDDLSFEDELRFVIPIRNNNNDSNKKKGHPGGSSKNCCCCCFVLIVAFVVLSHSRVLFVL